MSESTIKIGDKVKIINEGSSRNKVGDVGEVVMIEDEGYSVVWYKVQVTGNPSYGNFHTIDEIELVEEHVNQG
jgi:hypothetical protein